MPKYRLLAPNGAPINAILSHKTVVYREYIDTESFRPDEDDPKRVDFDWDYEGDNEELDDIGTDYLIAEDGGRLFEDENGGEWRETQCKLEPVLDDEWFEEQAASLEEDEDA